jgi:tripartite-type tricarboxylate transporter receptor subunit TctC
MIGTEYVMKSAPDGYTLLLTNDGPITINPSLYKKTALDPLRELTPISNLASLPLVAVVHPSVPVNSVTDLINLARSQPGTLNYGSGGSTSRMGAELFKSMVGLDMVHVPYKGSGQMVIGLVGNEVQLAFDGISSSIPLIKSGKVRAIAVTGPTRSKSLPDIPTVDEAGVKGYQTTTWLALFGPKAMPAQLKEQLAADFRAALQEGDVRARMTSLGLDPVGSTPSQFAEQLQTESKKWKELITKAGITGEE